MHERVEPDSSSNRGADLPGRHVHGIGRRTDIVRIPHSICDTYRTPRARVLGWRDGLKPYLVRCAIGGACAAFTFLVILATPGFADGTPEPPPVAARPSGYRVTADLEADSRSANSDRPFPRDPERGDAADPARPDSPGCGSDGTDGGTAAHRPTPDEETTTPPRDTPAEPIVTLPHSEAPEEPGVAPPSSETPAQPVVTPPTFGAPRTGSETPSTGLVLSTPAESNAAVTVTLLATVTVEPVATPNATATTAPGLDESLATPPGNLSPGTGQGAIGAQIPEAVLPREILDNGVASALSGTFVALIATTVGFVLLHRRLDQREPKLTNPSLDDDQTRDFQ